nr:type II CRISPR RNA-guided endonuclease Cas9 [Lachnospiraceae bacterium]
DNYRVIECGKAVYDRALLDGIMKGYNYLSEARVASYEKHKADLKLLKKVVRSYDKDNMDYNMLFREEADGSYSAYVGSVNYDNNTTRRNMKGRKQEDIYKTIQTLLKKYKSETDAEDKDIEKILEDISLGIFLPKQLTNENGVIPNQVHLKELKKILENAKGYLGFLNDIDESGLTVAERIVRLFSFQIPYYIGPVTENSEKNIKHKGNGWVIRKESGQVFPWNINEKIDIDATSRRFIDRLVRECTYITGEKVMPKSSLLYERFAVLNEINNIKINGEKISIELKQDIYKELFEKGKKVTRKQLEKYLSNRGIIKDSLELTGIDIAINNSLSSYGKFLPIFGEKLKEDRIKAVVEDIIYISTVYGDAKKLVKDSLIKKYSDVLNEADIKRILGFKFKDWGRLSKEFIELPGCDKSVGENVPLVRMMWETNFNMMELIHSDQFTYADTLSEKCNAAWSTLAEFKYEDLDSTYFSAPVKRMVWQTLLIIKEINKIMGGEPKRLFVEMTRSEDDIKQRTSSRKQMFLDLYKSVKDDTHNWKELIEKSDASGILKSKKMYLYLTQMGHCMYTGEEIDLDELFNNSIYDIDHIYPRHFVKDDNIANNLVLVKRGENAKKTDDYPLNENIVRKQKGFWKALCDKGMIPKEKYNRLTGRNAFTEEQKADFIARQLVETSQGTKGVSEILKAVLHNTDIVYSKARNVSDFRHDYELPKSRLINDFHHANDAYLNIVVGNVYYTKFTQNTLNFIRKDYAQKGEKYNLDKMYNWRVERNGIVAWVPGADGTISTVKKVMAKNTPLLTRKSFEVHGALANETLYGANDATPDAYIPFKSSNPKLRDVTKYGGFTSVSGAYFFLVEHEVKGKRVRTIETLPIYYKDKVEKNKKALLEYCIEGLGLINPSIRLERILYQALIKKDEYYMHLSGKTNKQLIVRNAVELCVDNEWVKYICKLEKALSSKIDLEKSITADLNLELFNILTNKHSNSIYSKRPNAMGKLLAVGRTKFSTLNLEDQVAVLLQLLNLTVIGTISADLSLIGGAKKSGVMLISKNISNSKEIRLIQQSVTGVYEKEIDLLTI